MDYLRVVRVVGVRIRIRVRVRVRVRFSVSVTLGLSAWCTNTSLGSAFLESKLLAKTRKVRLARHG